MTDDPAFDAAAADEDEPDLADADLPTDEEEEDDPAPHDTSVTPEDPDAGDLNAGKEV